jgi:hypothetical protein
LICTQLKGAKGKGSKACQPCQIAKAKCETDGISCSDKRQPKNEIMIDFNEDNNFNASERLKGPSGSMISEGEYKSYTIIIMFS